MCDIVCKGLGVAWLWLIRLGDVAWVYYTINNKTGQRSDES